MSQRGPTLTAERRAKGYKGSQRVLYRAPFDLGTVCFPSQEACRIPEESECFPHPTRSAQEDVSPADHLALFPQT